MRVNWLVKYYFVAFTGIFLIAYLIESSEPYVNWSLYPYVSETEVENFIENKNCAKLQELFTNEYNDNYLTNSLGFITRKDKLSKRGLNLLKYLKYHLELNHCKPS